MKKRTLPALAALLFVGQGCFERTRMLTDRQQRILQAGNHWRRYSPQDQALIRQGRFRVGLDEYALYLARGTPVLYWDTTIQGQPCRVLLYDYWSSGKQTDRPKLADLAVYTCHSVIVAWRRVQPALPCWRLVEVGPRIDEHEDYFRTQNLRRQWEIVAGILRRGQTPMDLKIAFGAPYNTGVEAREDGTNAMTQVYLDNTGDAYGLYTTFVNGRLVAWRIPAERRLTPEAQARRLKAMEQRLMAQLKAMEARSIRRHQEQMALLRTLQANQETMMDTLSSVSARIPAAGDTGGGTSGRGLPSGLRRVPQSLLRGNVRTTVNRVPSEPSYRMASLNGKHFFDRVGGAMGQECDIETGCPEGYYCYHLVGGIQTEDGVTGMGGRCVPIPKAASEGDFGSECTPHVRCPSGMVCYYDSEPTLRPRGNTRSVDPVGRCVDQDPDPRQ